MWRAIRRVLLAGICVVFVAVFVLWRIDNPRVEALRLSLMDQLLPSFEWTISPITSLSRMVSDFEELDRVYEQNRELRRELQREGARNHAD